MGRKNKNRRNPKRGTEGTPKRKTPGAVRTTISACLIVKDEQEFLPRCLASIRDTVDEIIVVDTGSTDATVEIAEKYGCRIYHFPWTGDFAAARNESLKYAKKEWILVIDADEELPVGEMKKVHALVGNDDTDIISLTVFNKSLESGRVSSFLPSVRLFRRNLGLRYEGIVHNRLSLPADASVLRSDIRLFHYGYDLGRDRLKDKQKRSRDLLESQLRDNPDDVFANFNMAQLLLGLGGTEDEDACEQIIECAGRVIEHADRALTDQSGYHLMAHHQMAAALCALGRYDEARRFCLEALQEKEDYVDIILTLANIHLAIADLNGARSYYEKYLEVIDSYRPEKERREIIVHYLQGRHIARYGLATISRLEGRIEEALKAYREVLEECTPYLDTFYQIGILHLKRGEPTRAEDALRKEIEFDPDPMPPYIALARAVELQGRGDRAAAILETALIKAPHNPDILLSLAAIRYRLGQIDEGRIHLEAAVEANPEDPGAMFLAAGLFFELAEYDRARSLYLASLEHGPHRPEVHTNIGNCYIRQERFDEAAAAYETALALDPGSGLARRNLALTHARTGRFAAAVEVLAPYMESSPSDPDMSRLMGDLLSLSGRYRDAINHYERHMAVNPGDMACLFSMAEAYRKSGHEESAKAGFRHLLKMDPDFEPAKKRLEAMGEATVVS